jgi:glucose-1-phosphate adenylyltransferase
VIDRFCRIAEGTEIRFDQEADRRAGFFVTESGITLVSPDMLGQDVNHIR